MKQYPNIIFQGSTFPDDPYRTVAVNLNPEITDEYIPVLEQQPYSKGLKLLMVAMTDMEGFYKKSRSYRTNNPGNVGNTDTGANKKIATLEAGVKLQAEHIMKIVEGKHKAYPLGKAMTIKPYYSPEIAKNEKLYGIPAHLPGYQFTYTGQLDQFIKIYSTGARATNNYIDQIVSYFAENGFEIAPSDTLSHIVLLEETTPMEDLGRVIGEAGSTSLI